MFNYGNLSDYEFELLVKDIMQRKLKIQLRTFAVGRDGGVDISDRQSGKEVLIQVKHYFKSTPAQVVNALRKEQEKIKLYNPREYYVVVSRTLTPKNIQDIHKLFKKYMPTTANIISAPEIDDFLHASKNQDILERHFKLWLESTNILNPIINRDIWIDSQDILQSIQEKSKYYIETSFFQQAYKILNKDRILLITGNPGIGKTATSEMIVAKFATQGYQVRSISNVTKLDNLKKSLNTDPQAKEIILLDDCFGQCYFRIQDEYDKELSSLIRFIKTQPNKVLLLNSRVTIYNEAKERYNNLTSIIDNNTMHVKCLEISDVSLLEKAQILYNRLFFQNFPEQYWQVIRNNDKYLNIIKHHNCTPRIIEFITRPSLIEQVPADDYLNYIKTNLQNPEGIWQNEFEKRLTEVDRILLTTLYSLTENTIEEKILKECFNERIKDLAIDKSVNQYNAAAKRLTESFLCRIDKYGQSFIRVANPSVNDFLKHYLADNQPEIELIKRTACSLPQIVRLYRSDEQRLRWDTNEEVHRYLKDSRLLNLRYTSDNNKVRVISSIVARYEEKNINYKQIVQDFCKKPGNATLGDLIFFSEDTISKLLKPNMIEYYNLEPILKDPEKLKSLIGGIPLKPLVEILANINHLFTTPEQKDSLLKISINLLQNESDEFLRVPSDQILAYGNIVDNIIRQGEASEDNIDDLEYAAQKVIADNMQNEYWDIINGLPNDIQDHLNEECNIYPDEELYAEDARELVRDYMSHKDYEENWGGRPEDDEIAEIRRLFAR